MKKLVLFGLAVLLTTTAFSQVGIGTTTPDAGAVLDLTATNKALLLTRVATTAAVANPVNGLMVYDISNNCVRTYEDGAWSNCLNGNIACVTSTTGKCWMDRNLGATRVARSVTDRLAYGDLYQWGRNADGHQVMNWTSSTTGTPANGTTTTRPNADQAATPLFILRSTANFDWRGGAQNDNLWQGVSGINNPCPAGYRVPTITEWTEELTAYNITNDDTAFASPLKITNAGNRAFSGGLLGTGTGGYYWSSTVSSTLVSYQGFTSTFSNVSTSGRANGLSVRCLKN